MNELEFNNKLDSVVKTYGLPSQLSDYLVSLLSYSYFNLNKVIYDSLESEKLFNGCFYFNSLITHCSDYGYSVFRGSNQRFIFKNCRLNSDLSKNRFDLLYYSNDTQLLLDEKIIGVSGDIIDSISLVATNNIYRKSFSVSPKTPLVYIINSVISNDISVTLNGVEIYPNIVTLPGFGILIMNLDEDNNKLFTDGILTVTYLVDTEQIEYDNSFNSYFDYDELEIIDKIPQNRNYDININNTRLKYLSKNQIFSNNDVRYSVLKYFNEIKSLNIRYSVLENVPWFKVNVPKLINGGDIKLLGTEYGDFDSKNNSLTKIIGDNEYKVELSKSLLKLIEIFGTDKNLLDYQFNESNELMYAKLDDIELIYKDGLYVHKGDFISSFNDKIEIYNLDLEAVYKNKINDTDYYITNSPVELDMDYDYMVETDLDSDNNRYWNINDKLSDTTYRIDTGLYNYEISSTSTVKEKSIILNLRMVSNELILTLIYDGETISIYNISNYGSIIETIINDNIYKNIGFGQTGAELQSNININITKSSLSETFNNSLVLYYREGDRLVNIFEYRNSRVKMSFNDFILLFELNYNTISVSKSLNKITVFKYNIGDSNIYANYYDDIVRYDFDESKITLNNNQIDFYSLDDSSDDDSDSNYFIRYDTSKLIYYNYDNLKYLDMNKDEFNMYYATYITEFEKINKLDVKGTIKNITINLSTKKGNSIISAPYDNPVSLNYIDQNITTNTTIPYYKDIVKNNDRLSLLLSAENIPETEDKIKYQFYTDKETYSPSIARIYRRRLMKILCIYNSDKELSIDKISKFNEGVMDVMYNKLNSYISLVKAIDYEVNLGITIKFIGILSDIKSRVELVLNKYELIIGEEINYYDIISDISRVDGVEKVIPSTDLTNIILRYDEKLLISRSGITYEKLES